MKQDEIGSAELLQVVPMEWAADPHEQLIAVRDAVQAQRSAPTVQTPLLVAAAYDAIKKLPQDFNPPERAETLIDVSCFHYLDAHAEAALDPITDAVYSAVSGHHKGIAARAYMLSGSFLGETYNFTGAVHELTRALEIAMESGDVHREARVWNNLGACHLNAGQYADALAMFEKVLSLRGDDIELKPIALQNIALVALHVKDIPKGIRAAKAALQASHDPQTAHECLTRVQNELTYIRLLLVVDQVDHASKRARMAREVASKSGSAQAETLASLCEALTEIGRGQKDVGCTRLKRSIEEARRGSPSMFRLVLTAGVQGYELAGEPDVAILLHREYVELNKRTKGAGLLHHLRRELRDVDLALDSAANAALVEQEAALLVGQSDPARARARFRLFERASVGAELHDDETGFHVFRVGTMSRELARAFGMPEDTCQVMDYAARLHDLGKISLPEGLLMKPGKFTPGERAIMETHTTEGARLIREGSQGLVPMHIAEEIALGHHEKWDGSGYPNKLKGNLIPMTARIVALADVFDALTHARCYKPAWTIDDSIREIASQRGKHFDPDLTDLFLNLVPDMMRKHGDIESYLSASGRNNPFIRDRAAINRELRGDGGLFDGRL
jgi:putative two-component system response regulator